MKKNIILSIDPGRGKCGVALLYKNGRSYFSQSNSTGSPHRDPSGYD